ncbi:hypothetical protein GECvBGOT_gp188 [Salmonella phage GEC_vB_GOT]|nr:hypothetical protein GECvBGOT_gp188 [Salmonella phage GEC_vB_GOT]
MKLTWIQKIRHLSSLQFRVRNIRLIALNMMKRPERCL